MNEQQLRSLARLLAYLDDEKKDFENASEEARSNHVYLDMLILEQYLKKIHSPLQGEPTS